MSKPSLPQGTRDFAPEVVRKRNYIFHVIREAFERYGFQPLETPAFENLETLMGKYGEEGDKLIFKILNNGLDQPARQEQARSDFEKILQGKNSSGITERALKYDLTIPFARFVAMNHPRLHFPFKRYQVQPVWRADRPQRGRYREFYQCDADVVGSKSLLNEIELVLLYHDVFAALKIDVTIKLNSRKLWLGLAEIASKYFQPSVAPGELALVLSSAVDKLDKVGPEKVQALLAEKGLTAEGIQLVEKITGATGDDASLLTSLRKTLADSKIGIEGIDDLSAIVAGVEDVNKNVSLKIDTTLARGLDYYTGAIFEITANGVSIGSIGGGGRYDNLTGLFGVPDVPGVGISFGVDRIYDVMEELQLFPASVHMGTEVLFFNLGEAESRKALQLVNALREKGVRAELFHEVAKFDRQFKYAEKKAIPFVAILGDKELQSSSVNLKNLSSGEQQTLKWEDLLTFKF